MLGQRLIRGVAEETAIRADTGTDITKCVKKETFLCKVSTVSLDAKSVVDEVDEHRHELRDVSFWKDGSRLDSRTEGVTVAWRYQQT